MIYLFVFSVKNICIAIQQIAGIFASDFIVFLKMLNFKFHQDWYSYHHQFTMFDRYLGNTVEGDNNLI